MRIAVIGPGYVGLPTAAVFAEIGHTVWLVGRNAEKHAQLQRGEVYLHEKGLQELIQKNIAAGRFFSTLSYAEAIPEADVVFIAVGTPSGEQGEADLKQVFSAAKSIAEHLSEYTIIVNKSTVPVGTGDRIREILTEHKKDSKATFDIASCPEFLREGTAVEDALHPDRIVIGIDSDKARDCLLQVHGTLPGERLVTDMKSAELIKYASNAFLATKISFINEIANICENVGADVEEVARGMGLDSRIGPKFLKAGLGWSGSCFPKDVRALNYIAFSNHYEPKLLKAVVELNNEQRRRVVTKVAQALGSLQGKNVTLLGLAFKPHTDDARESAAIDLLDLLKEAGAQVRLHDPIARPDARPVFQGVVFEEDVYRACTNADAIVIATEWPEFKELDWKKIKASMHSAVLIDGRNLLDSKTMRTLGWKYVGVGRFSI